jgi:hypothetical protein
LHSDFDYLVRGFTSTGGKDDSEEKNYFQEVESASLLIRQKMFDQLVEIKDEKEMLTVYFKHDLAEKASYCLGGRYMQLVGVYISTHIDEIIDKIMCYNFICKILRGWP